MLNFIKKLFKKEKLPDYRIVETESNQYFIEYRFGGESFEKLFIFDGVNPKSYFVDTYEEAFAYLEQILLKETFAKSQSKVKKICKEFYL